MIDSVFKTNIEKHCKYKYLLLILTVSNAELHEAEFQTMSKTF